MTKARRQNEETRRKDTQVARRRSRGARGAHGRVLAARLLPGSEGRRPPHGQGWRVGYNPQARAQEVRAVWLRVRPDRAGCGAENLRIPHAAAKGGREHHPAHLRGRAPGVLAQGREGSVVDAARQHRHPPHRQITIK